MNPVSPRWTYQPIDGTSDVEEAFLTLCHDAHIRRYLLDDELVSTEWLQQTMAASARLFRERGVGLWLLRDAEGVAQGFGGFHYFPQLDDEPQLTYAFRAEATGRGNASEVGSTVIGFARRVGALTDIPAAVDAPNVASVAVLNRLGFQQKMGGDAHTLRFVLPAGRPPTRIYTQRLILRHWEDDDRAAFARMNANSQVMEFFPSTLTEQQSDSFASRIEQHLRDEGWGLWAVEIPGQARFIGFTGLAVPTFDAEFTPCVEIGWRLAEPFWGNGYATEAARAVLDIAFSQIGLQEVLALTATINRRSIRIMEKLGMQHDPAENFDHPRLAQDSPLRRHVVYRTRGEQKQG